MEQKEAKVLGVCPRCGKAVLENQLYVIRDVNELSSTSGYWHFVCRNTDIKESSEGNE